MEASYSTTLETAFVIRPEELTRLVKLLETHVGKVKCRADCSDGISRDFSNINDLVQYENPRSKEIVCIKLTARSVDFSKNATIDLSGSKWRSIYLDFSADEDAVSGLKNGTLDIMDGARPWYGVIQTVDFVSIGFTVFFLVWLYVIIKVARGRIILPKRNSPELTPKESAIGQLMMIGVPIALCGVGLLVNHFRDSLFPHAVFAIGQGRSRFENLERFHWGFLIAIIASVVASILVLSWQSWRKRC